MAVDVCSASEAPVSPRISFSHDLNNQSDQIHTIRSDQFLLTTTSAAIDFNFDFCTTANHQISSADELFSGGKILPAQIKTIERPKPQKTTAIENSNAQKKSLKEFVFEDDEEHDKTSSTPTSRSFWQFRRSSSLNCDNGGGSSKGLLRSLSLKSLSRSNSTPNPKRNVAPPKVTEKLNSNKEQVNLRRCSSLSQTPTSDHVYYSYNNNSGRRPPLKSCRGGGYGGNGGGIRIIPVLNVPPAYNISKGTLNLFGLGSFFCNGKSKKKNR